jgi:hypothetical protein
LSRKTKGAGSLLSLLRFCLLLVVGLALCASVLLVPLPEEPDSYD